MSHRQQEDQQLSQQIQEVFEHKRATYGSPRIQKILARKGIHCGCKRVARLMREQGLAARIRRRHPHTTVREPAHPVADNVLNREFQASAPNERWVGDITYISTQEGWLYLAVILDLYSRRCVGWAMGEHPDEQLAEAALRQALVGRQPPRGLLHHTDRGSTYTSAAYRRLVTESGMITCIPHWAISVRWSLNSKLYFIDSSSSLLIRVKLT